MIKYGETHWKIIQITTKYTSERRYKTRIPN